MAKKPLVALVMGSTSDLPHVEPALEILKDLGIPYTARILSSHRTPEALSGFARNAKGRGIKVIVALAGAAAHLAGVIASYTDLPVIGVPMAVTTLAGFDALLSTVQLPSGVPVATMGIGTSGAKNALLFAARILALEDPEIAGKLEKRRENLARNVLSKDEEVASRFTWTGEEE